jgi:putative tricarboxylic transport membrane protein
MEIIDGILYGFSVSFQPLNLFLCLIGVLIGTLVGVLPGLGPVASISLLLPITFRISSPVSALIMLSGIYYGAQYGGSTTSILVNIPGEATSVVTCLDGYQMARKGRAGAALGISAFGSFIAGTLGVIGLMLVAPALSEWALHFGPPEYCTLMFLGFTILSYIAKGSMVKAFTMAALGLILGTVGMDFITGVYRFSYGVLALEDGFGLIPVVMGIFGISEVLLNIEEDVSRTFFAEKIKGLYPSRQDWKESIWPIGRGTLIGFILGILPGGGPIIASFMAYIVEKKISKHPERFGEGAIAGVAAPESANNAAASAAFIPMLTLGIPSTASTAILLGGPDGLRRGARPVADQEGPGCILGGHHEHVCGECHAPHSQPPVDRHMGEGPQSALSDPFPADPFVLPHRRIQHQQQHAGYHHHEHFRDYRLPDAQVGI